MICCVCPYIALMVSNLFFGWFFDYVAKEYKISTKTVR